MAENKLKDAVTFEGLSQYRVPLSYELAKKKFYFVFDDGKEMLVDFIDGETLSYTMDGETFIQKYECEKADETIYMVMSEKKGSTPREGFILVFDTYKRLVTGNFVKQGTVADHKNLVTREVRFGYIAVPGKKIPTERHAYTEDLVGKMIQWTYTPGFTITHCYVSATEMGGARERDIEKLKAMTAKEAAVYTEQCIYVKLNDYMYIMSWIEKGSGTEGFCVINIDRVHDVGCFWGANPQGEPEAYCFAAYGNIIK